MAVRLVAVGLGGRMWTDLGFVSRFSSPREIRQGEEVAWYADGDTVVRSEQNPNVCYAYGMCAVLVRHLWLLWHFTTS